MSFTASVKGELLKTKRSSAFWVSLTGAAYIPVIFLISYLTRSGKSFEAMQNDAWNIHITSGWQAFAGFLLPMFVIIICGLIPQLEYRNNAWKQLFTTPQSIGGVYFSKLSVIVLMLLFLMISFNILLIATGFISNLFLPKSIFSFASIDWSYLLLVNVKAFISILSLVSLHYWMGLNMRNVVLSIGIGIVLLITTTFIGSWEYINIIPYAHPSITMKNLAAQPTKQFILYSHELLGIVYFIIFTLAGYFTMKLKKQLG